MARNTSNGTNFGFESELWRAADALRSNMDAAEHKHVVLGLIFLKYISDAFEEQHKKLDAERSQGADPEDPDEYRAANIFWVPKEVRWSKLKSEAKQPTIDDIRQHNHILTLGRYAGAAEVEHDGEPFEERMARLTTALREQTEQAAKLDKIIWANLEDIGSGG